VYLDVGTPWYALEKGGDVMNESRKGNRAILFC
jgi:hypothetical protein